MNIHSKKTLSDATKESTRIDQAFPVKNKKEFAIEQLSRLIFTPIDQAVEEVKHRRAKTELVQKVKEYLGNDIPEHFDRTSPVFYLQRFIATPNHELFHTAEVAKQYNLPLIVGEDLKNKFNTNNELKLPLGKLPVVKGLSRNKDEIIEYFTVMDFNDSNGKQLNEIDTKFGASLVDFHHSLFNEVNLPNVEIADETHWIDRNHRDDIYEQYKKVWALLCVHGIMVEYYLPSDYSFFTNVVYPSFKEVEKELGVTPLVVEHITPEQAPLRNWYSYPSFFYQFIKRSF